MWDTKGAIDREDFRGGESHKILEPMFDHGTTRIWSFTDVHSATAVCPCAVLLSPGYV